MGSSFNESSFDALLFGEDVGGDRVVSSAFAPSIIVSDLVSSAMITPEMEVAALNREETKISSRLTTLFMVEIQVIPRLRIIWCVKLNTRVSIGSSSSRSSGLTRYL